MATSVTIEFFQLLSQARWYQSESSQRLAASQPGVPRLDRLLSSLPDPLDALNKANLEFLEWMEGSSKEVAAKAMEEDFSPSFFEQLNAICLPDKTALQESIVPFTVTTLSLKDVIASARVWDMVWFWVSNLLSQSFTPSTETSTDETSKQPADTLTAFCLSQLGNFFHSQTSLVLSHDDGSGLGNQHLSLTSFIRCWIPWVLVAHRFEDSVESDADQHPPTASNCKISSILYEVTKSLLFSPTLTVPHPIVEVCTMSTKAAAAATVAWVKENALEHEGSHTTFSTLSPLQLLRRIQSTTSEQSSDAVLSNTPWRHQTESNQQAATDSGVLFSMPSVFESLHGETGDTVLGSGWGYDVEREPGPFSLDDLETLQQQIESLEVEAQQMVNVEPTGPGNGPPAALFGNLSQTLEHVLGRSTAQDEEADPTLMFDDEGDFLQSPSQAEDGVPSSNLVEEVESTLAACSADTLLYFLTSAIADSDVSCSTALNILDGLQQSVQYADPRPVYRGNGKLSVGFQELIAATELTMQRCLLEHAGDGEVDRDGLGVESTPQENTLKILHSRAELITLRDNSIPLLQ